MKKEKTVLTALVLALFSTPSLASDFFLLDQSVVGRSNNVAWFDIGVNFINHKDPDIGGSGLSTSENGWIPAIQLGASVLGEYGYFLSASGSFAGGSSNYTGFDASLNPTTGFTENTMFNVSAQVGWNVSPFESFTLIPYVEGNYSYWNRETSGDLEYTHMAALAGLKLQFAATNTIVVTTYGAYGTILSPEMQSNTGGTDTPEKKPIYRIGTKLAYSPEISPRYELFLAGDYTSFEYGESPTYPTDSFTNQLVVRAGMAYRFR